MRLFFLQIQEDDVLQHGVVKKIIKTMKKTIEPAIISPTMRIH